MQAAAMAEHKFKIGEIVSFQPKVLISAPGGAYQIIRRLPFSGDISLHDQKCLRNSRARREGI